MERRYKQLRLQERDRITEMKAGGFSLRAIAEALGHRRRKAKGVGRKERKTKIPNRIPIEERPLSADNRSRFGHWEGDSLVSRKSLVALNTLVRWYFPKGTDFGKITSEQVARVESLINTRPRKCLGYKTPLEVAAVALRG